MEWHVLILSDSRGVGLLSYLRHQLRRRNTCLDLILKADINIVSGARINEVLTDPGSVKMLHAKVYDTVYILAGVNHLTVKHLSGYVTPIYTCVGNLVEVMNDCFQGAKYTLDSYGQYMCICQQTGIDLNAHNHTVGQFDQQQKVIDAGMVVLNKVVATYNVDESTLSPHLMNTIHALDDGRRYEKYKRFYDGLHPDPTTKKMWAYLFSTAIIKTAYRHLGLNNIIID